MTSSFLEVFEVNETCKFKLKEEDKSYTFPFPLDDFQEAGCAAIEKQENVLITAHTGSGKTVLALYGIGWAIKNNKKAIYYAGFVWKKAEQFETKGAWENYLNDFALKTNNPLTVTWN